MARVKVTTTKYSGYSSPTIKFMQAVEKFIVKKYGGIEPHWDGQLQLLATNYELFILAKTQVREDGLMIRNRFGQWDKHPLLRQITDSNIQCVKLIHEFGLSPSALGKIKEPDNDDNEENELLQLLSE
jgi:P27 family predicted phage terminase small subunit